MSGIGELLKGSTDLLLLYLIRERPMYGYELIKEMEKRSRGYFRFKEGTLYPALHRLEKEGLLSGHWERLPSSQERRYYAITRKGEMSLGEKVSQWQGFVAAVNWVLQPSLSSV